MEEIVKHINDTNASFRSPNAGDAKNTDLFLDNEHFESFKNEGEQIVVRFDKENLSKSILFIASILPRKYDNSSVHKSISYSADFVYDQLELLDAYFVEDGISVSSKTQTWNARKDVLKKNGKIDNRFYFNGLIEEFSYKNSKGEYVSAKFTIRNYLAGGYSDIHIKKADDGIFDVWVTNTQEAYFDDKESGQENLDINDTAVNCIQTIFYGAPGTGKSHKIKELTKRYVQEIPLGSQELFEEEIKNYFFNKFSSSKNTANNYISFILADVNSNIYSNIIDKHCTKISECYAIKDAVLLYNSFLNGGILSAININSVPSSALKNYIEFLETLPKTKITKQNLVFRTTFHPDSDYSTFVGCYKPTTMEVPMRDVTGKIIRENGTDVTENKIIYTFVPQAFLKAYAAAWNNPQEKVYLVIEEINRGNCAQIFGDLFQLLDRNESGESDYPIQADNDIVKYLKGKDEEGDDVLINKEGIEGGKLKLPSNLYIWATMNTSDQSLFPIDSAFKRRWDWQYMPIAQGRDKNGNELQWAIDVNGNKYSWWSFIEKINAQIGEATQSEDKKLGFFFCKANNGVISPETFVGKVVFYLWNDVFKDYGFEGSIFKDADNSELSFNKFYKADVKGNTIVQKDKVELFLNNLGVEIIGNRQVEEPEEDEDEDGNDTSTSTTGRNYDKFSINGVGRYAKNNLAAECVKKYIELNPGITAEEVMNNWSGFKNIVPHFMESKEEFDARTDNSKRSHEIQCNGSVLYVAHNGYGSNGKAQVLMDAVNQKGWGLTIERHNA